MDFVTVAPPKVTTLQQISISSLQAAQQKSLAITEFHKVSPRLEIWLGTRGGGGSNPLFPTNVVNNLHATSGLPSHRCVDGRVF